MTDTPQTTESDDEKAFDWYWRATSSGRRPLHIETWHAALTYERARSVTPKPQEDALCAGFLPSRAGQRTPCDMRSGDLVHKPGHYETLYHEFVASQPITRSSDEPVLMGWYERPCCARVDRYETDPVTGLGMVIVCRSCGTIRSASRRLAAEHDSEGKRE